ncbi:PAAR-like protein [Chitinophaga qingshengii]|uniref:DUF4280 domain-containing protein n=1 Tax=Chitinophaga qingshengii TaxID=1569794 RepID=A0ABR7TXI7_9BACT|nr:PAAR-like protein [Chitinophaga qingshengii]MBC9934830.1 DUF4280 domain-containing protein [Chitinophaga qingshengii]
MSDQKKFVLDGAVCKCSQSKVSAILKVTSQTKVRIQGKLKATEKDLQFMPPFFGNCNNDPKKSCTPQLQAWQQTTATTTFGGSSQFLLESSSCKCSQGGTITIDDHKQVDNPVEPDPVENTIFIGCIRFYRSADNAGGAFGMKDNGYNGEFGFDAFNKATCAEGLIGEYQELIGITPAEDAISGVAKYLCPYLSIWPPDVEGNTDNKKSTVTLYVNAQKASKLLKSDADIVFSSSNANITLNTTTLHLKIDDPAVPLTITCKGPFEEDVAITAKAKGEPQVLGKLIIKANAVRYKTIIQPVELSFGAQASAAISAIPHTPLINDLIRFFNTHSFNQAYIYGVPANDTKKVTFQVSEFENAGLLLQKEDGNRYLKKDTENDPDTVRYNRMVEQRFAAYLVNQEKKQAAREDMQKKAIEVLKRFDKHFEFKTGRKSLQYTLKQYEDKIASKAWNHPDVQKAYADYSAAKTYYDTMGSADTWLKKDKILYFFYTNDIYAAKKPDAKVLAYSETFSGVAHIFQAALTDTDVNGVVMHELGHALGLRHTFDEQALGTYSIKEPGKTYRDDVNEEIRSKKVDVHTKEGMVERMKKDQKAASKEGLSSAQVEGLGQMESDYSSLETTVKKSFVPNLDDFVATVNDTIQKENGTFQHTNSGVTITSIEQEITKLESEIKVLEGTAKSAERTMLLKKAKAQHSTKENYLDYSQDSQGNMSRDFKRKTFYQWQWQFMQLVGKSKRYFEEIK